MPNDQSVFQNLLSGLGTTIQRATEGSPIHATQLSTLSPLQQLAQMGFLGKGFSSNYNAPSIAPIAREEQRRFNQETVPQLMEQFAGMGDQSALLRGIQGAGGDLQSKLGALAQQQQFELQKQRNEMNPRYAELGLRPSFSTQLTDKPITGAEEPLERKILNSPRATTLTNQAKESAQNIWGNLANKFNEKYPEKYEGMKNIFNKLSSLSQNPVSNLGNMEKYRGITSRSSIKPNDTLLNSIKTPETWKMLDDINALAKEGKDVNGYELISTPEELKEFHKIISRKHQSESTKKRDLEKLFSSINKNDEYKKIMENPKKYLPEKKGYEQQANEKLLDNLKTPKEKEKLIKLNRVQGGNKQGLGLLDTEAQFKNWFKIYSQPNKGKRDMQLDQFFKKIGKYDAYKKL